MLETYTLCHGKPNQNSYGQKSHFFNPLTLTYLILPSYHFLNIYTMHLTVKDAF